MAFVVNIFADSPSGDFRRQVAGDVNVVLDGALIRATEAGVRVNYLLGDLDTLRRDFPEVVLGPEIKVEHIPNEDFSDLDKGIVFAKKLGATKINIFNALGGRADHTLYNMAALKRHYNPNVMIEMCNEDESIMFFQDATIELSGQTGDRLSFFALPYATVSTSGLKYNLTGASLTLGEQDSLSNELMAMNASINVIGGIILIRHINVSYNNAVN